MRKKELLGPLLGEREASHPSILKSAHKAPFSLQEGRGRASRGFAAQSDGFTGFEECFAKCARIPGELRRHAVTFCRS